MGPTTACRRRQHSTKPPFKTAEWPNINSFDSFIVKNTQFYSCTRDSLVAKKVDFFIYFILNQNEISASIFKFGFPIQWFQQTNTLSPSMLVTFS